ncbi:MAG: hypothetical protein RL318_2438 [Fibrobacterota bacterium]
MEGSSRTLPSRNGQTGGDSPGDLQASFPVDAPHKADQCWNTSIFQPSSPVPYPARHSAACVAKACMD